MPTLIDVCKIDNLYTSHDVRQAARATRIEFSATCRRYHCVHTVRTAPAVLVDSGVDLVFCDLPVVAPVAMGRFLLTQTASVAELEAGLISERTKVALAAAKVRGVKLGNPNGARALGGKQTGNKEAVAAIKQKAQEHADSLCDLERHTGTWHY